MIQMIGGKMKWIFFWHRIWGLSVGLFMGTLSIEKPLWLTILLTSAFVYFMVFGNTHFRRNQNE